MRARRAPKQQEEELEDFGRFSEPALLVLISLADGPKHGYAMTEDIEAMTEIRMGPGTLYGAITRLEADDRRNPYRLTALGERALRSRLASIEAVARVARRRLAAV